MRLRLLGEVGARVHGREVDLGGPRQRCVLVALAVDAGQVVAADRLAERVWGADASPRARATLHSYISRLRRALGDAAGVAIVRRSGGYALMTDPAEPMVDLHRFRDLRSRARAAADDARAVRLLTEALDLWRGDALTGLDGEWADAERVRLRGEQLAAQHDLVEARLRLGHGADLVPELSTRAKDHPLDERVAGQYLTALHQAGRVGDALEHYRRFRTRMVEELGADPGAAIQALHQRILAADPPPQASPPDAPAAPRQLPAPPGSFVGRAGELDRLDTALGSGTTVVISAISGAGGIGKTWLALHWAHRHAHRFPDGQLFVDLRGFSPENAPMAPAVAVRGFLDTLGVEPDRIPVDLHAQSALFRSLLAAKRILLVLDNAADTAQVSALLPGSASCSVVVTSRNRLTGLVTGHGARHLPLDVLSGEEARALLADRLGAARVAAEPAAVDRLVELCGGFPLALSIVAGHALTRLELPLAVLAAELRDLGLGALDDVDPTASLPAVLSWSRRALTADQARAFELLGLAPGSDLSLPAAASLVDASPYDTSAILRGLEHASLVTQHAPGRWGMHDLIRRYAAHADQPFPEAALRRLLDFYLHTADAADRLLYPHSQRLRLDPPAPGTWHHLLPDFATALAWFDAEHANLLAAQQLARARGWHRTVWQLTWALNTFQTRRGHRHDQLTACRAGLAAAEQLADPATRILAHRLLGRAYVDLGRRDDAIEHLHQALALAGEHDDPATLAHTHRTLAWAWEQWGDDRRALEHATHALDIHRTLGNPLWEAMALNAVGWCAARLADHDRARDHCRAALTLFRRHGDPNGEAATLDSLGWIDHQTGRHREAVRNYEQALARYRDLGDLHETATTLANLGHPLAALGRDEDARAAWQEAQDRYRQQGRHDDAERVRRLQEALDLTPTGGSGSGRASGG